MKKGFTLIELMAVVIIIALISILTFPNIVNQIKKGKDQNKRNVENIIVTAAKKYVNDNPDKYNEKLSCIKVEELVDNDYLKDDILDDVSIKYQVMYKDLKDYKLITDGKCGYTPYKIGDKVTYNGMDFYVIQDSDKTNDRVTMLKAEPLTTAEVKKYGVGHTNMYNGSSSYYKSVYNSNGYGQISYYVSETCGYVNGSYVLTGCTNDYNDSEVKYVVDEWVFERLTLENLVEDSNGYKVRLITYSEFVNNLGCINTDCLTSDYGYFVNSDKYVYWTMSPYNSSNRELWVANKGLLQKQGVGFYNTFGAIRPVVTLKKSAFE